MLLRSYARAGTLVAKRWCKPCQVRHSTATALHFLRQLVSLSNSLIPAPFSNMSPVGLLWAGHGRGPSDQGTEPASHADSCSFRLCQAANYVRTELAIRIAHRLRDLQTLPYVVVTQEGVARVYELYWSAFEEFRRFPQINTLADNDVFCQSLNRLLHEHATVIPNLTLGLSLSSPHIAPEVLDSFMRRMLTSRISRRVLVEHHIALSNSFRHQSQERSDSEQPVGIIYTGLNVTQSIQKCVMLLKESSRSDTLWPEVIISGHLDTKFSYIREHIEYIVFELIKNAMWATVVKYRGSPLPPIQATIVAGEDDVGIRISDQGGGLTTPHIKSPSDLFSFSHIRNASRMDNSRLGTLRTVSSDPRGVMATVDEQLSSRAVDQREPVPQCSEGPEDGIELGIHPRMGIGLPMSNIYATYFGGSLELISLDGWGTDVYLRLPKLGTQLEGIEV